VELRIILADNQMIFRTGAARVLSLEDDMDVAAQCADLTRLREAVGTLPHSVVIFPSSFTADLPDLLDWIDQAGSKAVIVLEHGATLEDSIAQRVDGVLLRSVAGPQLIDCVHRVAAGERCLQRASLRSMPSPDRVGIRVLERLTPKEVQIMGLVAEGCKNREIALRLETKEQVVKNYLRAIFDKTGVSDRLELALFTIHHRALAEAAGRARPLRARSA